MDISKEELLNIQGGAAKYAIATIIGGLVTFIIGFFDGYFRPLPCRK